MFGCSIRRSPPRGFTLLEVLAALLIASILAAAALPTMTARVRDQRAQRLAQQYAMFYREGRMRAMGRGTAHLVRFSTATNPRGSAEIHEAVQVVQGGTSCENLPRVGVNSCAAISWGASLESRLVDTLVQPEALFSEVFTKFFLDTTEANNVDICFSPGGRSYIRGSQSGAFAPFVGVQRLSVKRPIAQDLLSRDVVLLPNGSTRVETVVGP